MTYTAFDYTKPDPTVGDGADVFTNTRANLLALRDAVLIGVMPGWSITPKNADESGPPADYAKLPVILYTKGTERLRSAITWSGDLPASTKYEYSADSGSTYATIGTENYAFDDSDNCTSVSWA